MASKKKKVSKKVRTRARVKSPQELQLQQDFEDARLAAQQLAAVKVQAFSAWKATENSAEISVMAQILADANGLVVGTPEYDEIRQELYEAIVLYREKDGASDATLIDALMILGGAVQP